MYGGIPFSPQVALADSIGAADTVIKVTDISAFPDAPSYATIGTDEEGETILYAAKTADSLSGCTRGVEGTAKSWPAGSTIARNFTNVDFATLQKNVRENNQNIQKCNEDVEAILTAGPYVAGTTYKPGNVVTYAGSTWRAKAESTGVTPVEGEYWTCLAARGNDGYTPRKGTDYWTAADKQEMVNEVIASEDYKVGDLTQLQTTAKNNLVAAINEVAGKTNTQGTEIATIKQNIQNLTTLTDFLKRTGAARANSMITEYSLGTSLTAAQSEDIRSGRFELVRPGGYWTINGRKYWVAHADYRLNCGDTALTTHHVVVFPDVGFYDSVWNDTNTTAGGYYGSKIKTSGLASALATIKSDFGASHVLKHRQLLTNAISGNDPSGWAWYDSEIDLMNEHMVYGARAWGGGAHNGYDVGIDKSQLALFAARPDLICNRQNWWLRDVPSAANACHVLNRGFADSWHASSSLRVRPAVLIY